MLTKRKVYLFAISLAFIVSLLNAAPWMVYNSTSNDAFSAPNVTTSVQNEFQLSVTLALTGAPPEAADDSYVTDEELTLVVSAPGVLSNDQDVDGDALAAVLDTPPAFGSLILSSDGSLSYTPDLDFFGLDTFTYHANDGQFDSNPATVTITVNLVNDPPVAVDDAYETDEDTTLDVTPGVLANDYDVDLYDFVTAELYSPPEHGSLTFFLEGDFIYTPDHDWNGIDHFEYRAFDTFVYGNIATVTITVHAVNDAPVAVDDKFVMDEDTALPILVSELLSNDYDVDGDSFALISLSSPSSGTLDILSGQELVYTPFPDWYGFDSFTYYVSDGVESSALATVTIEVQDVTEDSNPPTTTFLPDGILGDNGWYISDVVVTLSAIDDFAVQSTMYSRDGKNWMLYTGPFTISTDGINYVYFYSTDTAGNEEEMNSAMVIIDTDITGPVITIIYTGDATDGYPGYWTITVVDPESGISAVTVEIDGILIGTASGDYAVPNALGLHTIRVNATNGDLEVGIEDQEFSTLSETVTIIDDDTTAPQIAIIHTGDATVSDPGFWTVTVSDLESGIASLLVEIDGAPAGTIAGDYAVPASEGEHTIVVTAYNGDLDRGELDQEMSVESMSITVSGEPTPGWVTGGGWITDSDGRKGHFAFVVRLKPDGDLSGMFLYSLKIGKSVYMIMGTDVLDLTIDGNHAYFEVDCTVMIVKLHHCKVESSESGYLVQVDVWDIKGKCEKDIFQIRIIDPSGQVSYEAGYDSIGYVHGAIVIHEYKRMKHCHCHHGRW